MKIYTKGVEDYINWLIGLDYEMHTIKEGSLGYGITILTKIGFKSVVIKEKYINEWSSGHTIRKYNRIPKVYKQALEAIKE